MRINLVKRNILLPDTPNFCALCEGDGETSTLFFFEVVSGVWYSLIRRLDSSFISHPNLFYSFRVLE